MRKVLFVTINVLDDVTPLACGYMQAYACQDPAIQANWEFEHYVHTVDLSKGEFLEALIEAEAHVYAISCYVWNMGLVKRTIFDLQEARPDAHILLGGPQVMNHADRYLRPEYDKIAICNGEGEKTFYHYLKALMATHVDLSSVKGLSFYGDGTLITTEPEQRIQDLNDIPSPYLSGLFSKGKYAYAMLETNRGCPFSCSYCYWGAAIGSKVYKMSEERVQSEIEWIADNSIPVLMINDANWGMLRRDVEFSRHIANCKREHDYPLNLIFCSAKNSQKRVTEISEILQTAGLQVSHPVSLQTTSAEALRKVNRSNIKADSYQSIQFELNDRHLDSYIELIWPLPGETLTSFKEGINHLCRLGAYSYVCWPLLLMNNVELNNHREEYGIVTALHESREEYGLFTGSDEYLASEAEVVLCTNEVSLEDCREGWRFVYVLNLLFCMRGLHHLAFYLDRVHDLSYADLYSDFVAFVQERPDTDFAVMMEEFLPAVLSDQIWILGLGIHRFFHTMRQDFTSLLFEFASMQPWWEDEVAQLFFEIDLLNQPYLYHNFVPEKPAVPFKHIQWLGSTKDGYQVQLPPAHCAAINELLGDKATFQGDFIEINHRQNQLLNFYDRYTEKHLGHYCLDRLYGPGGLLPVWQDLES